MRFCARGAGSTICSLRRDLKTALHSQGREAVYDLTVQLSTKVELLLNLKTAKALGLAGPVSSPGRANEVNWRIF